MRQSKNLQTTPISIDQADECYRSALRRVAIYLNSGKNRICSYSWLKLSDEAIQKLFSEKKLDHLLISYLVSVPPNGSTKPDKAPDDVRAEHEFYGRFQFQSRRKPNRLHVTFNSTEVFREWSLIRLSKPEKLIKSLRPSSKVKENRRTHRSSQII